MDLSITLLIVIATVIVSFSAFNNPSLRDRMIFHGPSIQRGQWYRFLSSGLIHAHAPHLIFNMLALYLFGENVEHAYVAIFGKMGGLLYLAMYVLAMIAADIPGYVKHKDDNYYASLGASGAVSAVVFASILFYPIAGIGVMFIPIRIAGFIFGIIYLVISHSLAKRGGDGIDHSAHFFGALFGVGFTIIACQLAEFPILKLFIKQIEMMRPEDFIQVG